MACRGNSSLCAVRGKGKGFCDEGEVRDREGTCAAREWPGGLHGMSPGGPAGGAGRKCGGARASTEKNGRVQADSEAKPPRRTPCPTPRARPSEQLDHHARDRRNSGMCVPPRSGRRVGRDLGWAVAWE